MEGPGSNLARRKNATLPIHRLPTELFIDILKLVPHRRWGFGALTPSLLLQWSSVAASWRHIIVSTASLWRYVDLSSAAPLVDLILSRNTASPIDIAWLHPNPTGIQCHRLYEAPKQRLSPRCQCLYLNTTAQAEAAYVLGEYGAYAEDISLFSDMMDSDDSALVLPPGPPLKSLSVNCYILNPAFWDSRRLTSLRSLFIAGCFYPPEPLQMYALLSASQQLSILALQTFFDDFSLSDPEAPFTSLPVITLQNLQFLQIRDVGFALGAFILKKIRCPTCEYLDIGEIRPSWIQGAETLLGCVNPCGWGPYELRAWVDCDRLEIENKPSCYVDIWPPAILNMADAPTKFKLTFNRMFQNNPWEQVLRDFGGLFRTVKALTIYVASASIVSEVVLGTQCDTWRQLVELRLIGEVTETIPYLRHLGRKAASFDDEATPSPHNILPSLFHLHIGGKDSTEPAGVAEELISMINERYGSLSKPYRMINEVQFPHLFISGSERLLMELRSRRLPACTSIDASEYADIPLEELLQL